MKTLTTLCLVLLSIAAYSTERVALLVGNSAYSALNDLSTPANNATALKTTLESPAL
jgi:hypothetical protein